MPTYEYACRGCGEHVEVVQSFRDDPLTTCGLCNGSLRKVFSAAGIVFKGSGYYVTDTRAKSGDGAKSDAKPAEKTSSDTTSSDTTSTSKSGSAKSSGGESAAKSA
jgi:putative FmdB family regulatory protein